MNLSFKVYQTCLFLASPIKWASRNPDLALNADHVTLEPEGNCFYPCAISLLSMLYIVLYNYYFVSLYCL
ncbi:hypothetical protein PRUPE_2G184200 [Prunus persica]|uniref:Uncharacterized protein n=1 Tax=Prunus persica TaxID=3760 RepID=A0A251QI19_PRUPE|nr:hypothetical protein PRUPE_2G184200 [Prunus persica]